MIKSFALPALLLPVLMSFSLVASAPLTEPHDQNTQDRYKDGTYEGQSRASYTAEPYWGRVRVTIKDGSFAGVYFTIRDSNLHETFNENYERHFQGNQVYIQQSRNDWNGVKTYPGKLTGTLSPGKVDAMSGATWSYNIFMASLNEALKNAK